MKQHNLNIHDFNLDEIISIDFIGDKETIDISVEDTHMFYCNDIYTHNSNAGNDTDIIEGKSIAGSYEKLMIADFVASQNRTVKDKVKGTGKWHIIKNRFGPDGMSYPAKINFDIAKIHIFNEDSEEGKQIEEIRNNTDSDIKFKKSNNMNIDNVKKLLNNKIKSKF